MIAAARGTPDFAALPDFSRHELDLEVAPLPDGNMLKYPVKVLAGRGSSPTFVAVAGIHGDEPEGMLALLDLWAELDPAEISGRCVFVPIANPPAFAAGRRTSPLDNLDLNRIFPGRANGTPSQRLAHHLFTNVVSRADLLFTLHSWYSYGVTEDFVECPAADGAAAAAALQAAKASGFGCIRVIDWPEGLLARVAIAAGVPAIEAEIGGQGTSTAANRARYRWHARNLMRHIGMLGGEAESGSSDLFHAEHVLAPVGGLIRIRKFLGEEVEKGALLATIHDLHDRPIFELSAPGAGRIGAHRTFVSVNPGDNLFTIFRRIGPREADFEMDASGRIGREEKG